MPCQRSHICICCHLQLCQHGPCRGFDGRSSHSESEEGRASQENRHEESSRCRAGVGLPLRWRSFLQLQLASFGWQQIPSLCAFAGPAFRASSPSTTPVFINPLFFFRSTLIVSTFVSCLALCSVLCSPVSSVLSRQLSIDRALSDPVPVPHWTGHHEPLGDVGFDSSTSVLRVPSDPSCRSSGYSTIISSPRCLGTKQLGSPPHIRPNSTRAQLWSPCLGRPISYRRHRHRHRHRAAAFLHHARFLRR